MKKVIVFYLSLLGIFLCSSQKVCAQFPVSDPHCAYCDVNLKKGEPHKSWCEYNKNSSSEKDTPSTSLKDYKPAKEKPSRPFNERTDVSMDEYGRGQYRCPECLQLHHRAGCQVGEVQSQYRKLHYEIVFSQKKWKKKALREAIDRREELWKELKRRINNAWWKQDHPEPVYTPAQPSQSQAKPATAQHITNTEILNNYDKKLSFDSFASAYGKTFPNGTERWVLVTQDGKEVGAFSKVEFVEASGIDQYILVRDDNGLWGIYSRGANHCMSETKYESIKMLTPFLNNGEEDFKTAYFDVARRDEHGVLKHGLFNPNGIHFDNNGKLYTQFEITPCEYDQIEMINAPQKPSLTDGEADMDGYSILAKVKKNGCWGIIDEYNGKTLIPIKYSYINTYFTLKKGRYLIVGDGTNFGAYYSGTREMEEVVPVTVGYTLDKVKKLIDEWERE